MEKTEYQKQWDEAAHIGADRHVATGYHYSDGWYEFSGIMNVGRVYQILNAIFIDRKKPIENKRFLEIGCGNARMTKYFAKVFKYVYAVDCSETMIQKALKRMDDEHTAGTVTFCPNDGSTLETVDDNFIDIVFSYIAFQHMEKETTESYLKEAVRVLRPGGVLMFQLPLNEDGDQTENPPEFNGVAKWKLEDIDACLDDMEVWSVASSALDYHIYIKPTNVS